MFINKIINELQAKLINHDWFAEKIIHSTQHYNTLIVYVHKMNSEIINSVPSEFLGFHILVHFIGSIQDKYAAQMPKSLLFNHSDITSLQLN